MQFCSVVSEELRWQTVWRTDRQTTGQKQYVSPPKWGGDIKHNTICVEHHYTQTNTNNVNKTWALQITGGKDEISGKP